MNFSAAWYLIYTRPKHEKKVNAQLAEQGITCFLPSVKKVSQWHDRKKTIEVPLFPSYVFVYLNDLKKFYHTIQIPGFLYFVKSAGEIAKIPEAVVNGIQTMLKSGREITVTEDPIKPGTRLTITEGVMHGLTCEVINYRNQNQLLVRMNLLQRNVLVTIPAGITEIMSCAKHG